MNINRNYDYSTGLNRILRTSLLFIGGGSILKCPCAILTPNSAIFKKTIRYYRFIHSCTAETVSENDQEIPQSRTADKPQAPQGSHTTITRYQKDKQSRATSSVFPVKMIAKLKWT